MKFVLHATAVFTLLLSFQLQVSTARAQGTTAFTYQGQLHDNGTNANGNYTMIFALYDSLSGGSEIGGPLTNSLILANGLFTANLDFGAGAFNGNARWLDITITNGGATQELSPRVQVLPAPYALYAANANVAASVSRVQAGLSLTNEFITNGIFAGNGAGLTNLQLNGLYSNAVVLNNTSNSFTGAFAGNGGGLTNLTVSALTAGTNSNVLTFNNPSNVFNGTVNGALAGNGSGVTNIQSSNIVGLVYKNAVQEATTTNNASFSVVNGNLLGAGPLIVDGIAVQAGDSVLVKNQNTNSMNGIYICTTPGSMFANCSLTRRGDFNSGANITVGTTITVTEGVLNTGTAWVLTNSGPIVVGTSPLNFVQFIQLPAIAPGNNVGLMTNSGLVQISSFVPNIQVFHGTNATFVVPTNVTRIMVEMWGGGGGGGSGYYGSASGNNGNSNGGADNAFNGGGGGAGGYAWNVFTVIPGGSYSVVAPADNSGGQTGGTSSFSGNGISMTAGGGGAGQAGNASGPGNGGSGGASTGSLVNVQGGSGDNYGDGGGVWRGAAGSSFNGSSGGGPGGGGPGGSAYFNGTSGVTTPGSGGDTGVVIIYY